MLYTNLLQCQQTPAAMSVTLCQKCPGYKLGIWLYCCVCSLDIVKYILKHDNMLSSKDIPWQKQDRKRLSCKTHSSPANLL